MIVDDKSSPFSVLFPSNGILPTNTAPSASSPKLFTILPLTVIFLEVSSIFISIFFTSSSSAVSSLPSIEIVFVVTNPDGATTFILPSNLLFSPVNSFEYSREISPSDDGAKLSNDTFATILINAPVDAADVLYFVS